MTKFLLKIWRKLFGDQLDFRARMFNTIGTVGVLASLTGVFVDTANGTGLFNVAMCVASIAVLIWALWYSITTGKYRTGYLRSYRCQYVHHRRTETKRIVHQFLL